VHSSSKLINVDRLLHNLIEREGKLVSRKMMTKEITKTTVRIAKLTVENGEAKNGEITGRNISW
jgi:hypothetical protein